MVKRDEALKPIRVVNASKRKSVTELNIDVNALSTYEAAYYYISLGLSVIPIRLDGSKKPFLKEWKPYQSEIANDDDLESWFNPYADTYGIGIVCGEVSGNLEVIDIESRFWSDKEKAEEFIELIDE